MYPGIHQWDFKNFKISFSFLVVPATLGCASAKKASTDTTSMFTTNPLLLTLHQDWKLKLSEWAADGSLGAAAEAAFRLEGRPAELAVLVSQWAAGDFSALPPIVLLPASSMPGAAGAYAISTGTIYLNQDWLAKASAAQAIAVLTEELGACRT